MASSSSANTAKTNSSLKRTLASSDAQHDHNLQPPTKKPKKETKLDKLKTEQKSEAGNLKTKIRAVLKLIEGKGVANETSLEAYTLTCDDILAGTELDDTALQLFEMPFKDHFQPDEVLLKNLGPSILIPLNAQLYAISKLLPKLAKLTESILVEVRGLPTPSSYAEQATWRVWQDKDTAILNLRPPANEGLPIETLHPAFATFVHDVKSIRPDEWVRDVDINNASLALCQVMGRGFTDEAARRAELTKQLHSLGLGLQVEFHIARTPPLETHSARPVLLGEVKSEFETGDPYMQVSRSYQALVNHLADKERASDGVPCVLLVVCGPLLTVAAGFFDGKHVIVEPLADPCTMLSSRYYRREQRLAHVLSFTRKAIRTLSQPSTSKPSPPNTPRIYPSYVNSLRQCTDLEFLQLLGPSSLNRCPHLLFLARDPATPATTLLVKLVDPKWYSEEAHRALADIGLAPLLHGTVRVPGAPSAIIMEYLDPSSGWTTLQDYVETHPEVKVTIGHPAFVRLLETMREKKIVHGDLRPNNIMCQPRSESGTEGHELEIKVVDFDWAGELGSARYPAIMNSAIKWPGAPGDLINEDDDGTLLERTLAMV